MKSSKRREITCLNAPKQYKILIFCLKCASQFFSVLWEYCFYFYMKINGLISLSSFFPYFFHIPNKKIIFILYFWNYQCWVSVGFHSIFYFQKFWKIYFNCILILLLLLYLLFSIIIIISIIHIIFSFCIIITKSFHCF